MSIHVSSDDISFTAIETCRGCYGGWGSRMENCVTCNGVGRHLTNFGEAVAEVLEFLIRTKDPRVEGFRGE